MNKKFIIKSFCIILAIIILISIGIFIGENDLIDEVTFSAKKTKIISKAESRQNKKTYSKINFFAPKTKITKNKTKTIEYQTFNNGLISMQIPKGWIVGTGKSDYIHYTFMVYNPQNPDFKIFFNMKTEGYLKTQQMRNLFRRYYPTSPFAKLPVISPQTTESFYKIFTQAYALNQNILPFKVPVIKNFNTTQYLGKNMTGGSIIRATYQNEKGEIIEGIFTATIKEFSMPPAVLLIVYNTVFFTTPEGELVNWEPILNKCLSSIKFSNSFINGYYKEQGQVIKNSNTIQSLCNQTSDTITSGWNNRQKTYDILSQKRSDATMGYERVQDTDTGEIYKATIGFSDHDWNGKYKPITDDMYNLPTAGYIEKR